LIESIALAVQRITLFYFYENKLVLHSNVIGDIFQATPYFLRGIEAIQFFLDTTGISF